jgi:glutathione S-transferase
MHKLYYSPNSCSLAPHIVLEEIGQPYETELILATDGKMTNTPEWRAINPKGRVPALTGVPGRIGGAPNLLTEVQAILLFLARSYPDARLLPDNPAGEARAVEWMTWLASNVHAMSFGQLWRPERFSANESCFLHIKAKGRENLRQQFAYIETLLSDGRDWAVSGRYSVVDPYLLVFYRWGSLFDLDMARDFPAWTDIARRVCARPAVGRVLAASGIRVF